MTARRGLAVLLLLALWATFARADEPSPNHRSVGPADEPAPPYFRKIGWRLPVGISLGGALHQDVKNQFFGGLELSLDRLGTHFWYTLRTDLTAEYDGPTRLRLGPGVGWHGYGFAAGYVGEVRAHGSRSGLSLRIERSLGGLLGIFGRWEHFFHGTDRDTVEIGGFIKFSLFDWFEDPPGFYCGAC